MSTSCCGWSSVLTLLYLTSEIPGLHANHIKYLNSGDSPYGGKDQVVGYHSFVFSTESYESGSTGFLLSTEDKAVLLQLARDAIKSALDGKNIPNPDEKKLSETIKTSCGVFVTLTTDGRLRGCIGQFIASEPLYRVVQEMAVASALRDTRFSPVTRSELKDIELEISVLTPLKQIESIEEFELGKHGIYMIKGNRSGTYLPKVADDTGWNKEEFLGHCAREKAGIGWDGWKESELYTYEALVFNENEILSAKK